MKEVIVTIAALILSFLIGIWTGDGTFFAAVVGFTISVIVATIAENRHNDT